MPRYHINSKGEPGLCRAKVECPFGSESDHYSSKDEARRAYEQSQPSVIPSPARSLSPDEIETWVVNSPDGSFRVQEMFDPQGSPRTVAINASDEVFIDSESTHLLREMIQRGWELDGDPYDPRPQAFSHQLESQYPIKIALTHRPESNHVSIDGLIVNKGVRREGIGSQVMEEIIRKADQQGWMLSLTPSTDFGASSVARLTRFYGRFGFVPNRGSAQDLSVSDSMIRPVTNP